MQKTSSYLPSALTIIPIVIVCAQMAVFFSYGFSLVDVTNSDLPYLEAYVIINLLPVIFYAQRSGCLYWIVWLFLVLADLYFVAVTLFGIGMMEAFIKMPHKP